MRGKTKERWKEICERAVVEQDPDRFVATIQELLQVLEDEEEQRPQPDRVARATREKPTKLSWQVA